MIEPTDKELNVISSVRSALTEDLRTDAFRNKGYGAECGHCFHAAQAVFFLLGGTQAGYSGVQAKDSEGISHWWVCSPNGSILDPTSGQYTDYGRTPPYSKGKRSVFFRFRPEEPTKNAAIVISRVRAQ